MTGATSPAAMMDGRDVVVLCHVALDERNGAGVRTILQYLKTLPGTQFHSVHFGDTAESGLHGLTKVRYWRIAKRPFPFSAMSCLLALRRLRGEFGQDPWWLLVPNTKADVQLCLASTLISRRTVAWFMDDFAGTLSDNVPPVRRMFERALGSLYHRASARIAVSDAMAREYQRRYELAPELVLGKRWPRAATGGEAARSRPVTTQDPLRLVWAGKYQNYYHEPIAAVARVLRDHPDLPVTLDLYGQSPPFAGVTSPGRVEYLGPFEDDTILERLRSYDAALLTYSFDAHTRRFMRYSFPSKIVDYLSAGLPVFTIAPRELSVCDELAAREVGLSLYETGEGAVLSSLLTLVRTARAQFDTWRSGSRTWAQSEFVFEDGAKSFRQLLV